MAEFYKKLESGSTTGNVIAGKNLAMIEPDLDLTDIDAVVAAGYCEYNKVEKPAHGLFDKKEYVEAADTEVSTGKWTQNWTLQTMTLSAAELEIEKAKAYQWLRAERDTLLRLTDFWALGDSGTMSSEMTAYRQALRDLPANTPDPFDVTWPTNPDDPDGSKK